jgi:hypothetical protein
MARIAIKPPSFINDPSREVMASDLSGDDLEFAKVLLFIYIFDNQIEPQRRCNAGRITGFFLSLGTLF